MWVTIIIRGFLYIYVGESRGRFKASQIEAYPDRKDCYTATLTIADMISGDSRFYYVTIGNDRGDTRYGIHVRVISISCKIHGL